LFLVLGASAAIPVGLLGLNQAERWAKSEMRATDRQTRGAARVAADQLSLAMLGYVHAAESFAAQVSDAKRFDFESLSFALSAHMRHHPDFIGGYVSDAAGRSVLFFGDGAVLPGGTDYSDRDYYQEIVRTGHAAISSVRMGRVTGVLAVQVAAPIHDETGALLGITCSSVDLGALTDQAKDSVRGMADGRVVILDGEGHRIADSDAVSPLQPQDDSMLPLFAGVAAGQAELRIGVDDRGLAVRGMAVGLKPPVASWRVVAMTPQSVVDGQARHVQMQTAALVFVLMLLALALSAGLAAWLARPLRALAMTAHAVTRGELDVLPSVSPSAPREMAQLAEAVRSMIGRLRGHAQDLELQVAARTADLSRANAEVSIALDTIRIQERRIHEDIDKARVFQEKLLPRLPERADLDIAVHYAPLEQVSGDIYDVLELERDTLRIFLADATGHGVQASMRTLILKSAYDRLKVLHSSPSGLLSELNAHLVAEFPDGELHCSACCVDIRFRSGGADVSYANAGSAPLYVFSERAPGSEIYAAGPLLGVDDALWPEPRCFQLQAGQLLVIATDGLIEQANGERRRFETELTHFRLQASGDARAGLGDLLSELERFRGGQAIADDVTVIALSPRA
jgi:serine phosphatase RsbU (regulator of sigma subunit)